MKRFLHTFILLILAMTWVAQKSNAQSCVPASNCSSDPEILLDCPDIGAWTDYFWDVRTLGQESNPLATIPELIRYDSGTGDYYFTPGGVTDGLNGVEVSLVLIEGTSNASSLGQFAKRVRVFKSPERFALTGPDEVCRGEIFSLQLDDTEASTTSYALWGGLVGSAANELTIGNGENGPISFDQTAFTAGDYNFYVIADNGTCSSTMPDADPANGWKVKVNDVPNVDLNSDQTGDRFCAGTDVTFTASGADEYTFYLGTVEPANIVQARSTDDTYNTTTLTDGDVVVVEGFDTSTSAITSCGATASVAVSVDELPTVVLSGDNTVCDGQTTDLSFALTGQAPWSIEYTDGTTTYSITTSDAAHIEAVVPDVALSPVKYTVTALSNGTCSAGAPEMTGEATVIVNEVPTGEIVGTTTICEGESTNLTFNLTGVGPWDLVYQDNFGNTFNENNIATSPHTVSVSPIINTTYTITSLTDANVPVCSASTLTGVADITVNTRPTSVMAGAVDLCEGDATTVSIDLTGVAPWNIEYSDGFSTYNVTANASPYEINVTPATNPAGVQTVYNYSVTALSDAACSAIVGDMTGASVVTVNPVPNVTLSCNPVSAEFCVGTDVEFTAGGADEYAFYLGSVSGTLLQGRGVDNTFNTDILTDGDVVVVIGYDTDYATDCNATASVAVTVNEVTAGISVTAPVVGGTEICAGTPVTFNASGVKIPNDLSANFNYEFHRLRGVANDVVQNGASAVYTDNALVNGDVIYVVVTETNSGCSHTSSSITITVNDNPAVSLVANPNPVCQGQDVTLTATTGFSNYAFYVNGSGTPVQNGASNSYITNTFNDNDQVYVTATSDKGCTASSVPPVIIDVHPLPTPSISGELTPCQNEVIHYTTDSGAGENGYVWTFTGGTIQGGGNGNDFIDIRWDNTGAQTVSVTYKSIDGCDPLAPTVANITVNSLPAISFTVGKEDVCLNSVETYSTQAGMSNYVWTIVGGTEQTNDGNGTVTVLWDTEGNGSVSVNYDNAAGCDATNPEQLAVIVHPLPTPGILGNDPVCLNSTERYTTEGGYNNYTWNVVGGSMIPTADPHIIDVLWTTPGAQSVSVNYEASAGNCAAAAPFVLPVFVNSLSVPTIDGPAEVCQNSSGNVYATEAGMSNYVWTITGGTIDSGAGSESVSVTWTSAGARIISVTYLDANNCNPIIPTVYPVTVNPLPVPSIAGASTVCNFTSDTYTTESGMSDYVWTVSAGGSISSGQGTNEIVVDWTMNSTQTITVAYKDIEGCDAATPSSTNITVVDLPNPTITGLDDVCEGHTITYTTQAGASNYDWQINGGTIIPTADAHVVDVVWTLGAAREISVNYELGSCPATAPFVLPVTVNSVPSVSLNGPTEACINTSGHVYTTESGQNNYTWNVTGGTYAAGAGPEEIIVTWDTEGAGSVSVNYDNSGGCPAVNPTVQNVTVHPLPVVTLSGNDVVCNTYREVYTTETGMTNYSWIVTGGTIDVDDNNGRIEVVWNNEGAQSISVSYTDANSCDPATPQLLDVTVNETPVPTIIGNETACIDNVEVYTTEAGFLNYNWIVPADGTIVNGVGTETIEVLWNTAGNHAISVNYENAFNCTALSAATLDVTVNPLSGVGLVATPGTSVIAGTEVIFTASGTDVVNYDYKINGSLQTSHDGSETFSWTPADVSANNSVVRVIATTSNGCKDSTDLVISVFEGLFPSVLEPASQSYCEGSPESVSIYVVPPVMTGVTYELIRNEDAQSIGTIVIADPTEEIRWTHGVNGVDLEYFGTATYKVEAYWASVPADRIVMSNSVEVIETPLPNNTFSIQPTGEVDGCNDGAGHAISLDASEVGVNYTLYVDGIQIGVPVAGDGNAIPFGNQLTTGTYTIIGERNGCSIDMAGTFTIKSDWSGALFNVNPNPAHGRFCTGSTGVEVVMDGSANDGTVYVVNYNGAEIIGSDWTGDGNAHTFGPYDQAGDYTVSVKTTSGCYYPMDGIATIIEEDLPMAYNLLAINDINSYCPGDDGVQLLLDNQEAGIRYTLYQDENQVESILSSTDGGQLLFTGIYLEGTYFVKANVEGITCEIDMNNSLTVVEDPEAMVLELQGETEFCEGGGTAQLFINNPESSVDYMLFLDDVATSKVGLVTGGQIVWHVDESGDYTVAGIKHNTNTTCDPVPMNNTISVSMTNLPEDRTLNVVDGTDCSNGTIVTIPATQNGMTYQLISVATDLPVPGYEIVGNGSDASFEAIFDTDGYYRVEAYNGACSMVIDDTYNNPIHVQITGVIGKKDITYIPSGPICIGSGTIAIQVQNPEAEVDYVLYRVDAMNSETAVDTLLATHLTDPIEFEPLYAEGNYRVRGYDDLINDPSGCSNSMLNEVTIKYNPLPSSYKLIGADKYCSSDPAILTLDGSEDGYTYILLQDDGTGNVPVETKIGDGNPLEFMPITVSGNYTVYSISPYGCTSSMRDTVSVSSGAEIAMQLATESAMQYCSSDGGATLELQNQEEGILYQVVDEAMNVVAETTGDASGTALILGEVIAGTYVIQASYGGLGCVTVMNDGNSIVVTEDLSPVAFNVAEREFNICLNEEIVINLDGSEMGRRYSLKDDLGVEISFHKVDDADNSGSPVQIRFTPDAPTDAMYEVYAEGDGSACDVLLGVIRIITRTAPNAISLNVTNAEYCAGSEGIELTVEATQTGIGYQLLNEMGNTISFVDGTDGVSKSFANPVMEGTYKVLARNYASGCNVTSTDVIVTENPIPTAFELFLDGGMLNACDPLCVGLTNVSELKLVSSQENVGYYLFKDGLPDPADIGAPGTGEELSLGTKSEPGFYSVKAIDLNGCENDMIGQVQLYEKQLIAIDDIVAVHYGNNTADTSVWYNDEKDEVIDVLTGGNKNIHFGLVDLTQPDKLDILSMNTAIGNQVEIYPDGSLIFTKLPTFYGSDSIDYVVYNTDYPDRRDTARVYFFVGNVDVSEDDNLLIPNAFSPNGDGINDLFVISGSFENDVAESNLEVFNRWGTVIYRSQGKFYGEDGNYWDGLANSGAMVSIGDKLPSGTYFYVFTIDVNIDGDIQTKQYTGYIELRR
ncbi:gliding motility-associated C-terminal domain-containing protein [Carboxylicivirga marina]|uniref:T9SS type B sorting domain-containing protein n=1 Tax=Carboxylicivirga marina TaxID=2800988 RepID=UPI0025977011|nr:gliding motility-associated C-terminal domain-containing protein [uncultured Carboxylicivirga sp.]